MALKELIERRLVDYYLQGKKQIAYELGSLYLRLSKIENTEEKKIAACIEGFYWLKIAGFPLPINWSEPDLQFLRERLDFLLKRIQKRLPKKRDKIRGAKRDGSPDLV